MAAATMVEFVQSCSASGLLTPAQVPEVLALAKRCRDQGQLIDEMLQRQWLSSYQVGRLLAGDTAGLVIEPYILVEPAGAGGMGHVFKARHRFLKRTVAIKLMRKDKLGDATALRRFYREMEVVAKLHHHPHIVQAFDAGRNGDIHFLVIEYIEGTDLGSLVRSRGRLPVGAVCQYVRQAALGLQFVHTHGLVHRDVKPSNLLLSSEGIVKVADLGLARARTVEADGRTHLTALTEEGMILGTLDYIAPEQTEDARTVDIRADIYSLGCTLYHLLTGQPPFSSKAIVDKVLQHKAIEATAVELLAPEVPAALAQAVRKMMAKQRDDRFETPADVAAALEPFASPVAPPDLSAPPAPSHGPYLHATNATGAATVESAKQTLGLSPTVTFPMLPSPVGASSPMPGTNPTEASNLIELPSSSLPRRRHSHMGRLGLLGLAGSAVAVIALVIYWLAPKSELPMPLTPVVAIRDITKPIPANTVQFPKPASDVTGLARLDPRDLPKQYQDTAPEGLVAVLTSNDTQFPPTCLAFSADGRWLAAGLRGEIRLWDVTDLSKSYGVKAAAKVTCLWFTADSATLFSGEESGVRSIDVRGAEPQLSSQAFAAHKGKVLAMCYDSKAKMLISATKKNLRLSSWPAPTDGANHKADLPFAVTALAPVPEGPMFALGSSDRKVRLLTLEDKGLSEEAALSGHTAPVTCLAVDPHGKLLASGSNDATIRFWDPQQPSEELPPRLTGHAKGVKGLSFSPDGRKLASCGQDGRVAIWNMELSARPKMHEWVLPKAVNGVAFAPDGRHVAAAAEDGTVRVFRVAN